MARLLPLPVHWLRHLLLALLAIGLVLRAGGACEAMAATLAPSIGHAACDDMPMKPHKPLKIASADCSLCAALLPEHPTPAAPAPPTATDPAEGGAGRLSGLSGGPAPPPPRIA